MRTTLSRAGLAAAFAMLSLAGCKKSQAAPGTLTGKATYSGSGDSSGIAVALNGPVAATTQTDSSGNYQFSGLPAGSYALLFTPVSALEGPQIRTAVVTDSPGVSVADVVFTAIGNLSGIATLGAATGNAGILVVSPGSQALAVTDDSGAYTLTGLSAGPHDLIASAGALGSATATGLVILHGQTTTAPDLTLQATAGGAGTISGQVVLAGVASAAGIPVALQGPSSAAQLTDSTGAFSFTGLNDGQYSITAVVHDALTASQEDGVEVSGGVAQSTPDFHFTPTGSISGTATFGSATGNAGITVTTLGVLAVAVTNDAGQYLLTGIPVGNHDLVASYPGKSSAIAAQVAVGWAQTSTASPLTLQAATPLPGQVFGHALLTGLTDNSGIIVSITGDTTAALVTAADGSFSFGNLPDGTYTLTASATSTIEGTLSRSFEITDALPFVGGEDFAFSPTGTIQGQVVNGAAAVPGAIVLVEGAQTSALTDASGHYSLANVPAGKDALLSAIGLGFASQVITVPNLGYGQTVTAPPLDVALTPTQQVGLAGQIQLVGGAGPLSSVQVAWNGASQGSTQVDSGGNWSAQVNPGAYSLSVSSSAGAWSETVPGLLAFPGGDGFIWQDNLYPLANSPLDLQYAKRVLSGSHVYYFITGNNLPGVVGFLLNTCTPNGCSGSNFQIGLYQNGTATLLPGASADGSQVLLTNLGSVVYTNGPNLEVGTPQGISVLSTQFNDQYLQSYNIGNQRIAFSDATGALVIGDLTGANPPAVIAQGLPINQEYLVELSPDDKYVWYTNQSNSNELNTVIPSGGCGASSSCPVAIPGAPYQITFSPDDTAVLGYNYQNGLFLYGEDGSNPVQIGASNQVQGWSTLSVPGKPALVVAQMYQSGANQLYAVPFTANATPVLLSANVEGWENGTSYLVYYDAGTGSSHGHISAIPLDNPNTSTDVSDDAELDEIATVGGHDVVVYLDSFSADSSTGTLKALNLDSGITTVIAENVEAGSPWILDYDGATAPAVAWANSVGGQDVWSVVALGSSNPTTNLGACPRGGEMELAARPDASMAAMLCAGQLTLTPLPGGTPVGVLSPNSNVTLQGFEVFENDGSVVIDGNSQADAYGNQEALVLANLDGTGAPTINVFSNLQYFFPSQSGDGMNVAYETADDEANDTNTLGIVPAGASQITVLGSAQDRYYSSDDELVLARVQLGDYQASDSGTGLLMAARTDGTVQPMIDFASDEFVIIPGTTEMIGYRQDSPAPWAFQNGVYVGQLPAPSTARAPARAPRRSTLHRVRARL